MQACPGCGTRNRESARFCDQCGLRLTTATAPHTASYTPKHLAERILQNRSALQGERKRVTVLFADIKGSTQLAEKIGAEEWHVILNRFFAILSDAVHRYEGTVNQYTGDGVMALFGAPIAHEDHAHRAALAALEMQREVRRYAIELEETQDLVFGMRVGLNTGEVVVGSIGDDLRMDYTAKGLTVNLAARMEQLCEAGTVYLSRYTAILIDGDFELKDHGERAVQGSSHPIRIYELLAERPAQARVGRQFARGQPLQGREPELAALKRALEQARDGGRIVAVSGEAGSGKSRLCHEFSLHCWEQQVPVHRATGVAYSAAAPLLPLRALLRSRLGLGPQADGQEVRGKVAAAFTSRNRTKNMVVPAIASFLGAGGRALDAGNLRSLMLERIARFLPRGEEPQVLLIEDLHYADPATGDFLTRLCEQVAGSHTLLLLNYRSDYAGSWFMPYLDEQLALKSLPPEVIEQIALGILGPARNLAPLAQQIAGRAGGNPFFVEEAVQALAESGYLWGSAGNYAQVKAINEWPIPHSVQALVAGRLDRLPEQQKAMLQTAAVIGRRFSAPLLKACCAGESFEQDIMRMSEAGFVQTRADGDYEFCHALTQEVCYHSQLETQRAGMHARVAAALEEKAPKEPDAGALQIAHHWQEAEKWHEAGSWNLRAAHWIAARDLAGAVAQFRHAIANLDRAEASFETLRLRIAARAGLIRMSQYIPVERAEVEQAWQDGWKLTEEFSDIEGGAELSLSYASELLHRGETDRAALLAAQGVSDAQTAACDGLLKRFRFVILMAHNAAGRLQEGLRLASAAGDAWLTRPVDAGNFITRGLYAELLMWQGHLEQAQENLLASIAWSERENREPIWQLSALVDWAWFSGKHEQAMERAELAMQRTQIFGGPFYKTFAHRALGLAQVLGGQHAQAVAHLEAGLPLVQPGAFGHSMHSTYLSVLAEAYAGAGRIDDAISTAVAAVESAQRSGARIFELRAWSVYMRLGARQRASEGRARMRELIDFSGAYAFKLFER